MTKVLRLSRLVFALRIVSAATMFVTGAGLLCASTITHVTSPLTITATFDSTITSDPNAASIESTINTAIGFYTSHLTTATASSINVTIKFEEMTSGLGESSTTLYTETYQSFLNALIASSSGDTTDTTALAHLQAGPNNPVDGGADIEAKTATLRALGYTGLPPSASGGYDGIIGLNTGLTTPGSGGSSLQYSLLATAEHEIDEVLGLGSNLNQSFSANPAPEDLFRYASNGTRSYTTNSSALAYFSVDGTTDLAQFDNQADGGDWGDWQSNPLPGGTPASVQDAFATPGSNPFLTVGSTEVVALDAIGYNLAPIVAPEPGSLTMFGTGLAFLAGMIRRRNHR